MRPHPGHQEPAAPQLAFDWLARVPRVDPEARVSTASLLRLALEDRWEARRLRDPGFRNRVLDLWFARSWDGPDDLDPVRMDAVQAVVRALLLESSPEEWDSFLALESAGVGVIVTEDTVCFVFGGEPVGEGMLDTPLVYEELPFPLTITTAAAATHLRRMLAHEGTG